MVQSRNITWVVVGTMPNVKLQYSRDNFNVDLQTITATASGTGTYAWTVPDAISNTVRVRVSDPNDIGAFDDSNADMKIYANFTIVAPNGGELWDVGSTQTITWTSAGSVTNVKLEYSINSGGAWLVILGLTPNDGTHNWLIPDNISANGRVRVSDPADATSDDISDNDFKIKAGFTLSSPNGSEGWTVGESRNVTWTNTGTVVNVKLTYSVNGGGAYGSTIQASASNTGTYAWTIPDAIGTTVRVKVESATDIDAFDTSDANFKIRGALTLTAPNGAEGWKIAQNQTITWNTTGTIANVRLTYSTNSGATYPNLIASSLANAGSFSWLVPDVPTTTARIQVEDVSDATVLDTSNANFSIQGNFILTAPNGGEVWAVDDVQNIAWNWGGTIPNVRLKYSTNSGGSYGNVITVGTANGSGSSGSFSFPWTIPDSISSTVRVKIEDPNDASVSDESNADFKIQGRLTMVAPNGGERWITNEGKTILWTTNGTVPNVKLEYSTDGGATWPIGNVIAASVPNANSYPWEIPNTLSTTARVRVSNAADSAVADASNADFKIDHYQITFNVKDLLSNNPLDQLTVNGANNSNPAYTWLGSNQASPILRGFQAGSWTATFTRVEYGDQSVNFVADQDQTVDIFMETQVVHVWEAKTELAYDPTNDRVAITSTLSRDGIIVPGVTYCRIRFFDGTALVKEFETNGGPDTNGFYGFVWNTPTGLDASKVYNVITTTKIATGGTFNTPRTFSITQVKKLQDVQDFVASRLDVSLSQVDSNIQTKLDAQTGTITSTLNTQTGIIETKLDAQTDAIEETLTSFEEKADEQINDLKTEVKNINGASDELNQRSVELEATNKKFAGDLLLPNTVLVGDKNVSLKYQGFAGLQPMITIIAIDSSNKENVVVDHEPMVPTADRPEVYEYVIEKISVPPYTPGKFVSVTVEALVFESPLLTDGPVTNIESGSFVVESTTLSTLEGLVAGQSGLKDLVQSVLSNMRAMQAASSTDGNISGLLQTLTRKIDALPREVAKAIAAQGDTKDMKETLNEVADQMRSLAGENMGLDFTQIVGKALDENATMADVRKKTDAVQGTTEVMQILLERKYGGVDAPVVHVVYQ